MTREEKAKKYDEALEWMRKVYPTLTGADKEDAEHYFPELAESEDEKIRKDVLAFIKHEGQHIDRYKWPKWIAWLEKQKENPKSADSISSDCVSDAKCENEHNEEGDFVFELRQIIGSHRYSDIYGEYTNDEEGMASEILELCKCELEKQKEQKPLEWSEEDEHRYGDAIYFLETTKMHYADTSEIELTIDWLKSLRPKPKVEWSVEKEPVDLEKEVQAFLCNYDYEFDDDPVPFDIAKHFYELGLNARKKEEL